jgi:hypothetical protein
MDNVHYRRSDLTPFQMVILEGCFCIFTHVFCCVRKTVKLILYLIMAADLIIHYLESIYTQLATIGDPNDELPAPITENGYEQATVEDNVSLSPVSIGKWEAYSTTGLWGNGWVATNKGKPIVFEIMAGHLTINFIRTNQEGKGAKAYVMIDGKKRVDLDADFPGGWGEYMESKTLVSSQELSKHRLELYYDDDSNKEFRIISLMVATH